MGRGIVLSIGAVLALVLSFISLSSSLFLSADFFNIFNFFNSLISHVNLVLLLVSIFLLSVFLAITFYELLKRENKSYILLYPFAILAGFVFFVLGRDLFSFILSVYSFCVSMIVYSLYFRRKEIYKEVPYAKLVSGASKALLTYIFLFVAIAAGYYAYQHPQVYERSIQDFLYKTTGMNMSNISTIEKSIQQEQYQQSYVFAKNIENYILYSIYNNIALEGQEKSKCLRAVNESMARFNDELKRQLSQQALDNKELESVDRIKYILSLTSSLYPLILAITLFFTLQIITFIIGIFTYVMTSLFKGFLLII